MHDARGGDTNGWKTRVHSCQKFAFLSKLLTTRREDEPTVSG
jgi:hypothetical protein